MMTEKFELEKMKSVLKETSKKMKDVDSQLYKELINAANTLNEIEDWHNNEMIDASDTAYDLGFKHGVKQGYQDGHSDATEESFKKSDDSEGESSEVKLNAS